MAKTFVVEIYAIHSHNPFWDRAARTMRIYSLEHAKRFKTEAQQRAQRIASRSSPFGSCESCRSLRRKRKMVRDAITVEASSQRQNYSYEQMLKYLGVSAEGFATSFPTRPEA